MLNCESKAIEAIANKLLALPATQFEKMPGPYVKKSGRDRGPGTGWLRGDVYSQSQAPVFEAINLSQ